MQIELLRDLQEKSRETGLTQDELILIGIRLVCACSNQPLKKFRIMRRKYQHDLERRVAV
jgi:hypothetical protein